MEIKWLPCFSAAGGESCQRHDSAVAVDMLQVAHGPMHLPLSVIVFVGEGSDVVMMARFTTTPCGSQKYFTSAMYFQVRALRTLREVRYL